MLFERMNRFYIIYRHTASKSFESRVRVNSVKTYNSFYNANIGTELLHKLTRVQRKFEIAAGNMTLMYIDHTVTH